MCLLLSTIICKFRKLNLGIMQTKFYFLLGMLVGLTSVTGNLVAQTACFGNDSSSDAPEGFQLSVETYATFEGTESSSPLASLAGQTTYRVYLETTSSTDFVSAVVSDGVAGEVHLSTSTSFYMDGYGGLTANGINPGIYSFFPTVEFDSYVTVGLNSQANPDEEEVLLSGEDSWGANFLAGGNLDIDSSNDSGSGWFIPSGASNGYAGEDQRVLIAQVTTDGELAGSFFIQVDPEGDDSFAAQFSFSSEMCGCNDETAVNFQPGATYNDGSCIFLGCTDSSACNFDSIANEDDGSCDYCCDTVLSENDDYGLEVELYADNAIDGHRTYRLYVTTANATDAVSAVAGYAAYPMNIASTTSFWQYAGPGGGITPNGWLDAYASIPEFADGAYDSYVTIGNTAAASGTETEVSLVETPGEGWGADFEAGGAIEISSASGGAWFLSPGSTSGIAGDDQRVLIGQFTTDGILSADVYVQIFPEGSQENSMSVYMQVNAPACGCMDEAAANYNAGALYQEGDCILLGCTDESACNYDASANTNDSCSYPETNYDCDGVCLNDSDGDSVCDEAEISGCFNPLACNYVAASIITDLEPCVMADAGYDCDGVCLIDEDGDGVCDSFEIVGCSDETACNYNADSTEEGVCDFETCHGCMDALACNYSELATDDDGTCDYCCATGASVEGYNITIEEYSDSPEGMTYRMYVDMPSASDVLSAVTGDAVNPTVISSTLPMFKSAFNPSVTSNGLNPLFFAVLPELAYDSWVTIGSSEEPNLAAGESAVNLVSSTDWEEVFVAGNGVEMNGEFGDGWYVVWDEVSGNYTNGVAGDDNRVLVGQFTTHGILSGEIYVQVFPEGDQQNPIQVILPFGFAADDQDAPEFTYVPEDVTMSCSDELPNDMAVAVDGGCVSEAILTFNDVTTDAECGYLVTRTFSATDAFGNVATAVQLISQFDSEAPVAVAQEDLIVECSDDLTPGAGVAEYPTGSYDNCADEFTFSYVDSDYDAGLDLTGVVLDLHVEMGMNIGGPFGNSLILEATQVTVGDGVELSYDDLVSNISSHRGAVTVDIEGDVINMSIDGTNGTPYQYDYAIVTLTNIEGEYLAGLNLVSNGIASGAEFSSSNTSNSIIISWDGTAVYSDGDAASLTVDDQSSCLAQSGTMRTWTVTDGCDNSDTAVQYFTIMDTEGPSFTSTPANLELGCNDEIPASSVTAEDCSGSADVTMIETQAEGSCGTNYTIYRSFIALDACGNESEHVQTIMVVDQESPVFTSFPSDVTYTYGNEMAVEEPTATDGCTEVAISYSDAVDNSDVEITIITRTWSASDACGNTTDQDQIITVNEVLGCMDDVACNYNAGASYDNGSCDYCSCGAGGEAGFGLELELVASHDGSSMPALEGMSTYRVYVTTPSTEDFVSSVSGEETVPAFLRSSTSFYQDVYGSISPATINPLFFVVVPSLEYDSWLTIGIESAPDFAANESDVTFVQAASDNWQSEFNAGNDLEINSFFGGSWFSLISSSNGYAGDDQRVLVAQLTTSGDLTGQLYVQVFPEGDQSQDTYLTLSFGGNDCGCMDEMACNYSAEATYDDGSCLLAETAYDCDGNCLSDSDEDGVCDELEIYGCTIETNCNYDSEATEYDAEYCETSPFCVGCNDAEACNFNPNVNPASNFNDGSCEYPEEGFDCEGICFDVNGDLICDVLQGCGDEGACNYEVVQFPSMDFCDFCGCDYITSSHEGYGLEIEEVASGVEGASSYHVYLTTANSTDVMNAVLGNALNPIVLASSSQFYQDPAGSVLPSPVGLFGFYPQLASDSWITIGEGTPNEFIEFPMTSSGELPSWTTDFEAGGNIVIDDAVGSGWYLSAGLTGWGIAGDDNRVLMAQLTTPGTLYGEMFIQVFPEGLSAGNTLYITLSFGSEACGCTDETACNYDAGNVTDDGSCYYASEGGTCEETCLYDTVEPLIDAIEDYTTSCEDAATDIRLPLASDNCDDNLDFSYDDSVIPGACAGTYTIVRTWTVTDNAGYSDSGVQMVSVVDSSAPTFTVPAEVSLSCTGDATDLNVTGTVTDAVDGCGSSPIDISYSDVLGEFNCFEGDVIIRTWTVMDDCGNASSQEQIINLVDDNAPFFTNVPADVDLECDDELPVIFATAEDQCSNVTVSVTDDYGDANCTGMEVIYRTFTAEDDCGNFGYAIQTITRVDTEAPVATVEDFDIGCGEYDASAEYGSYEYSDNCLSDITVSWMQVSVDPEDIGCFDVQREYTFIDGCGNSSTVMQIVHVLDVDAPVMDEVAAEITLQCGDDLPAAPGAIDACSSSEVTFADADNGVSCSGAMNFIRTYTATDGCGNAVSASMSVNYMDSIDPTFTAPADITVECDTNLDDLEVMGDVMDAADVCSADITVAYEDEASTTDGSCLADNRISRTWTVTDGCGNSASGVQIISLVDTTAPAVTYEENVILDAESGAVLDDFEGVDVYDACSGYTYTTTDTYVGSGITGYELERVMVFTDACGNSVTIEQNITAIFASGCTYEDAVNYNSEALVDDGSCLYEGCTDMGSANYNPIASVEDGSCVIVGCMDPDGLDYDPAATYPGSCDYPDSCPGDINDDGFVNVADLLDFFQYYGDVCE